MWSYYGSKSKIIDFYPSPKFDKIIEPFAGSARYALKYFDRDVLLVDKYPVIVALWKWLQKCSPKDITSLPDVSKGDDIRTMGLTYEESLLMGFFINRGSVTPKNIVAGFQNWNVNKHKTASQLYKIKHWNIQLGSYEDIENKEATWYIDPPYQWGGEHYKESNKNIDFASLAGWCKSRQGQAIVCENTKANWMDFYPTREMKGIVHKTVEAIWSNYPHNFTAQQQNLF